MKLGETREEEAIYEGIKILACIMARTIVKEILTKEESMHRRDSDFSHLVTNDAMVEHQERLTMSANDAAKLLGLSRSATYQAIHSGQIPSIRFGSRILIPRVALLRFINEVANDRERSV